MKQYTTNNIEQVYTSPRAVVERHSVAVHDGDSRTKHSWDVVRVKDAVAVLAVKRNGNLLVLENFRYAVNERFIELCAGLIETNEDATEACRRELSEEMGYAAGQIRKIGEFYTSPGLLTERIHLFFADDLSPTTAHTEDSEDLRVVELTRDQLLTMITNSEVKDAKTLIAFNWYVNYTR